MPLARSPNAARHIRAKTESFAKSRFASDATGHDWFHTDRVRRTALRLARAEKADAFVVELAALLHDVADAKFHGGDEKAGERVARRFLLQQKLDDATVDRVCAIVSEVSFKGARVRTPVSSIESACVQDADRLDAMGAIGVARAFTLGGHWGRLMHDPTIKPQPHASLSAYRKSQRSGKSTTLNHFFEKLFLLKDRLRTPTAKKIAKDRHRVMRVFVKQFLNEWNGRT